VNCKLPPGLDARLASGHPAHHRIARGETPCASRWISPPSQRRPASRKRLVASKIRIAIVTDGKTWERNLVHTGLDSCISLWVSGLPEGARQGRCRGMAGWRRFARRVPLGTRRAGTAPDQRDASIRRRSQAAIRLPSASRSGLRGRARDVGLNRALSRAPSYKHTRFGAQGPVPPCAAGSPRPPGNRCACP
jgi:hypothetical protein